MYTALIRSRIRSIFCSLNEGDYQPMLDSLAPDFEYIFHGDHALGGRRTTLSEVEAWWQRVFRLLPGHHFAIEQILVDGPPWKTGVAIRGRIAGDLPGGEPYENILFQFMRIRWGRVTRIETLENLHTLDKALEHMHAAGNPEATADPITGDELPSATIANMPACHR